MPSTWVIWLRYCNYIFVECLDKKRRSGWLQPLMIFKNDYCCVRKHGGHIFITSYMGKNQPLALIFRNYSCCKKHGNLTYCWILNALKSESEALFCYACYVDHSILWWYARKSCNVCANDQCKCICESTIRMTKQCKHKPSSMQNVIRGSSLRQDSAGYGKSTYTGCNRRNGPDFGRVFLRSYYTDITQNTYIRSSMVTEILAREVWNFDSYYPLIDYQIHIETGRNMWFL